VGAASAAMPLNTFAAEAAPARGKSRAIKKAGFPAFFTGTTGGLTLNGILPATGSVMTINPSTGVVSSTEFAATSDVNLKENIETIQNAGEIVSQLRGVTFDWKDTGNHSLGVIAQEIEKVLPELVTETDGKKTVSYGNMVGVLIEAIKELQNDVGVLKSIIENKTQD
jgi:hypothetical protein